jgi:hypothetical protein
MGPPGHVVADATIAFATDTVVVRLLTCCGPGPGQGSFREPAGTYRIAGFERARLGATVVLHVPADRRVKKGMFYLDRPGEGAPSLKRTFLHNGRQP